MAPSPVINLERELDRLFQAPFAEFVGTRNGLAAMLKKAGRVEESARIRGLAKPTYTSWLVNQLHWGSRETLDAFLKAADRVREAEHALIEGRKAPNHAELVAARTAALESLMTRASARAAEEGTPLSPALGERLKTTLEAIGAFGSREARHQRGRLQEDIDPPGFAAFAALASTAKAAPQPPRARRRRRRSRRGWSSGDQSKSRARGARRRPTSAPRSTKRRWPPAVRRTRRRRRPRPSARPGPPSRPPGSGCRKPRAR